MIRLTLTAVMLVGAVSLSLVPQKTAVAATIAFNCWQGPPPGFGPNLTVGCTFSWTPGPPGSGSTGRFHTVFTCLNPDCATYGNQPPLIVPLLQPPSAVHHRYVRANCTGGLTYTEVIGRGTNWYVKKNIGWVTQDIPDDVIGPVSPTGFHPNCLIIFPEAISVGP